MAQAFDTYLRELILSEHSRKTADTVVREIGGDPEKFGVLVRLLSEGPYRLTQRASRPLGMICIRHPSLVQPYLHEFILMLGQPAHPALHRNLVRLFAEIDVPDTEYGLLADACFRFLYDAETPVAVRCFSMTAIHRISLREPELARELCLYIEERMPFESAGFRSRGKKILAYWQKRGKGY